MPLTPADVHNVAFSKPPIGKRGYNEDEVDAFLDLVENELTRLIEENSDLRQRVSELDQELAGAGGGNGAKVTEGIPLRQSESEPEAATPAPEPAPAASSDERAMQAAKVLT
jgi:DivIVA domain-containing protein